MKNFSHHEDSELLNC